MQRSSEQDTGREWRVGRGKQKEGGHVPFSSLDLYLRVKKQATHTLSLSHRADKKKGGEFRELGGGWDRG